VATGGISGLDWSENVVSPPSRLTLLPSVVDALYMNDVSRRIPINLASTETYLLLISRAGRRTPTFLVIFVREKVLNSQEGIHLEAIWNEQCT